MENERLKYSILFAILGAVFFIPFLGGAHLFDWDEVNFAEASREMIRTGDYLRVYIDYKPFWEKPPLFFWFQAAAMNVFGVNEFAARLPNALCGIGTLVLLFNIGQRLFSTRFGLIWAGVYFGSILPHLYFRSGIIDPYFNLFIFLGLYYFVLSYWKKDATEGIELSKSKWLYAFVGGLFIGLAILTKGPVAYLIVCLTLFVYWLFQRFRLYVSIPQFLLFSFAALLFTMTWFGLEIIDQGFWFVQEFVTYQYRLFSTPDAGHKGFLGYHFVVLLVGCFPASIFALRSFFKLPESNFSHQKDFTLWMKILFWVVLILFSIVQSKIVHYSSLAYYPLTFLAALSIKHLLDHTIVFANWMKASLVFIGGLFVLALIALPFAGMNLEAIIPYVNDPFAAANMEAEVLWTGLEIIPGVFLLMILVFFFLQYKQAKKSKAFQTLFLGTASFVFLTLLFIINNIEAYSQRAAIDFFKSKVDEKCYIMPHGYKTYGHLFYADKAPVENPKSYNSDWLLNGDVDRPVYVICKIHRAHELKDVKTIKEIGRKNGFVFFKRTLE